MIWLQKSLVNFVWENKMKEDINMNKMEITKKRKEEGEKKIKKLEESNSARAGSSKLR